MTGGSSNTFTGDVIVSDGNTLSLQKTGGAIAIQGNVFIKNNSWVCLDRSNQISKTSTVTIDNASFRFWSLDGDVTQSLCQIIIEGECFIDFNFDNLGALKSNRLYLDDLVINESSVLKLISWEESQHTLLVRKDSKHLGDALSRIKIEGKYGSAGVRSYNWEYWEIGIGDGFSKLPEPSTYGAIFGGMGLVVVLSRKRRCIWRCSAHSHQKRKDYCDD